MNKIFDIIGVPSSEDWPKNAAVMRSNFQTSRNSRQNFEDIIPEIDHQAKDLLEVNNFFSINVAFWLVHLLLGWARLIVSSYYATGASPEPITNFPLEDILQE